MPTYGFIGLGQMGYPMCKNLRQKAGADSRVLILDLNKPVIEKFVAMVKEQGYEGELVVAESSKQVAEEADIIITMLPEGHHVKDVVTQLLKDIKTPGKLIIDCSTIDTAVSKECGALVASSGLGDFADCAVSGGPLGADAGTLTFMCGADSEGVFDKAHKVVSMMGVPKNCFHCGPVGSGVAVKAINNYLSGVTIIACSEAMNIGVKLGLDPKRLADIINVSSGQCWVSLKNNPVPGVTPGAPAGNNYDGGFSIELCRKVLTLSVNTAELVDAKLVLKDAVLAAYDEALQDEKCKGKDVRVMYKWLNEA